MDDKSSLRSLLRARRDAHFAALPEAARGLAFSKAPTPLAQLFGPGRIVAGYVAVGSEVDPLRLLKEAEAAGARLALPYIGASSQPMRFLSWRSDAPLAPGAYRIPQPAEDSPIVQPDIVLTPLVGFDRTGNRLGQGAGFYDRALSILPDTMRIGLAWSVQEVNALPADPWDEPLHAICTEREWIVP